MSEKYYIFGLEKLKTNKHVNERAKEIRNFFFGIFVSTISTLPHLKKIDADILFRGNTKTSMTWFIKSKTLCNTRSKQLSLNDGKALLVNEMHCKWHILKREIDQMYTLQIRSKTKNIFNVRNGLINFKRLIFGVFIALSFVELKV